MIARSQFANSSDFADTNAIGEGFRAYQLDRHLANGSEMPICNFL